MKKRCGQVMGTVLMLLFATSYAGAHCEIPCGIYDDQMRVNMIAEHITTMEKSMKQVVKLKGTSTVDYNQLVRWIMNKEDHANKLQEIVTQYFMTQRIKPDTPNYEKQVTLLHRMLVAAMKCKQTTDLSHIETLKQLLHDFEQLYMGKTH